MRILLINGNSLEESLSDHLYEYFLEKASSSGHEVRSLVLREQDFSPVLTKQNKASPEDVIERFQSDLSWCEHLVIVSPLWWMGVPALLKGYFDRVFTNGYAFEYRNGLPYGLLGGRSALVIYSQAQPQWYAWLFKGDSFFKSLAVGTLGFCGIKPVRRIVISGVRKMNSSKLEKVKKKIASYIEGL